MYVRTYVHMLFLRASFSSNDIRNVCMCSGIVKQQTLRFSMFLTVWRNVPDSLYRMECVFVDGYFLGCSCMSADLAERVWGQPASIAAARSS